MLKKIKVFGLIAGAVVLMSSCAMVKAPLGAVLYTDVKAPFAVTSNTNSSKVGTASARSILGIAAIGDASIDAACKNGGIKAIHHVDEQSTNILGLIATYKVIVYGE